MYRSVTKGKYEEDGALGPQRESSERRKNSIRKIFKATSRASLRKIKLITLHDYTQAEILCSKTHLKDTNLNFKEENTEPMSFISTVVFLINISPTTASSTGQLMHKYRIQFGGLPSLLERNKKKKVKKQPEKRTYI